MFIIHVPLVPPSPNVLRRKYWHPHAYRRLRMQWENDLFYGTSCARHRQQIIEWAKAGKMCVQIIVKHTRSFDADNLAGCQKPILDALKNIGFLKDDSAESLELLGPRQQLVRKQDCETLVRIGPAGVPEAEEHA